MYFKYIAIIIIIIRCICFIDHILSQQGYDLIAVWLANSWKCWKYNIQSSVLMIIIIDFIGFKYIQLLVELQHWFI